MQQSQAKALTAVAGVGLFVGIALAVRKANAAKAPSSRELELSDSPTAEQGPSSSAPAIPRLPASTAQEGAPLAWDRTEHPLADRGLDDAIDVIEIPMLDADPVAVPSAPASMPAPLPTPAAPPAPTSKPKAKAKAKPAAPPAPTSSASSAARTPAQAAADLFALATRLLNAGRGSELGGKGKPNAAVRAAQTDMGGITADGIYGPDTRARGRALLNKNFPIRK